MKKEVGVELHRKKCRKNSQHSIIDCLNEIGKDLKPRTSEAFSNAGCEVNNISLSVHETDGFKVVVMTTFENKDQKFTFNHNDPGELVEHIESFAKKIATA